MATRKITITLQDNQIEETRVLVSAGQAANVSALVKHAVGVALFDAAGWREMPEDSFRQAGGPLTQNERARADAILSSKGRKNGADSGRRRERYHSGSWRADRGGRSIRKVLALTH